MAEQRKKTGLKSILSMAYLIFAICLFLGICGKYYPEVGLKLRKVIAGPSDSPVREAFGVLTEGLGQDEPVKDVLSKSYEVLKG